MHAGLLAIHVWIGVVVAVHGIHKLSPPGWFGGYGRRGNTEWFASMGIPYAPAMVVMAGVAEVAGGLAFAAGFATPIAAALIVSTLLVAARTDHAGHGFWTFNNGPEYVLTASVVALGLAFSGPGEWSADAALGWELHGTAWGLGALAASVLGAGQILLLRRLHTTPDAQEALA